MRPMRATANRQERLLLQLLAGGELSVADLSNALDVGVATVRRDLQQLAGEGRVVRTYGGAVLPGPLRISAPADTNLEWKRHIAAAAAELVADRQSLVISSGTTTLEFARRIVHRQGLTVVTNALDIVQVLLDRDGIDLVVLGGAVRPRMHSLLGHLTEMAARELRADTLVMGIGAISLDHGLMNDHVQEVLTDRSLRQMVREVVVVADATKFNRVAPAYVSGLDAIHCVVTDSRVDPETVADLQARNVAVVIAEPPAHVRHDLPVERGAAKASTAFRAPPPAPAAEDA